MSNWEEQFREDYAPIENGITVEEAIESLKDIHWAGKCDLLTCPMCSMERSERR